MSVIVIANQKGGVGKSTVACLLVWWLHRRGYRRIALIDLDVQANSTRSMRAHAVLGPSADLFAEESITPPSLADGIRVFGGSPALADVDSAGPAVAHFARQVRALRGRFDAIVIDTAPVVGRRMIAALVSADRVVCPIELQTYSIQGLTLMLKTIFGVRERWNPELQLAGVLANRFNHHSASQREALAQLLTEYSSFVLPTRIAERSAIGDALSQGVPVWSLRKSAAREATREIDQALGVLLPRLGLPPVDETAAGLCSPITQEAGVHA